MTSARKKRAWNLKSPPSLVSQEFPNEHKFLNNMYKKKGSKITKDKTFKNYVRKNL